MVFSVPKSCLNMVKIQLDAFEAYGRDGNQVKLRFYTTDAISELFVNRIEFMNIVCEPIKRQIRESQVLVKIC